MKFFIVLMFVVTALLSCKDDIGNQHSDGPDNQLSFGVKEKIQSKILDQEREIWIYKPSEYYGMNLHGTNYPVVYVMDGESQFMATASLIDMLSSPGSANDVIPPMIVVGIVNIDRNIDLTPTMSSTMDSTVLQNSGGADKMAQFMEEELFPFIDSKYDVSDHRILIGHSLGGLYVLNTLIYHSELFTNYLSIDPFMAWDEGSFGELVLDSLVHGDYSKENLFVAMANNDLTYMTREEGLRDTSEVMQMMNSNMKFMDRMKKSSLRIRNKIQYYNDENHFQIPLPAMYDGFNHFYDYYTFAEMIDYYHPSKSEVDIIPAFEKHFLQASQALGYDVKPMESYVNAWAWGFVQLGRIENAKRLLELNISYYPMSAHTHSSMGYLMLDQKDTTATISYFEAALAIKEDEEVRTDLDSIRSQYH